MLGVFTRFVTSLDLQADAVHQQLQVCCCLFCRGVSVAIGSLWSGHGERVHFMPGTHHQVLCRPQQLPIF